MTAPPTFAVTAVAPEPYAMTPVLAARIEITAPEETGPVHAIALRCQVRIDPTRRRYTDDEAAALLDLFGTRDRWSDTARAFVWQHATAMVQGFTGRTTVVLPLECSYDFEVTAAKYLHALRDGAARLQFLFSGTLFLSGFRPGRAGFSVQQIPWVCEDTYDLPVTVWRDLMRLHYPDRGFVRLRHGTVAALAAYKAHRGLLDLDDTVLSLIAAAREEVT